MKLYSYEKKYAAMRDAGPELYAAAAKAVAELDGLGGAFAVIGRPDLHYRIEADIAQPLKTALAQVDLKS
jgi:7-keto-8-aminopelargonate synthetase-like enzyme